MKYSLNIQLFGTRGEPSFTDFDLTYADVEFRRRGDSIYNTRPEEPTYNPDTDQFEGGASKAEQDKFNAMNANLVRFVDTMGKARGKTGNEKMSISELNTNIQNFLKQYPEVNEQSLRTLINNVSRGLHYARRTNESTFTR